MRKLNPELINPFYAHVREHPGVFFEMSRVFENFHSQFHTKKTVVDLGCGYGHFLESYLERNPDFQGLGVEKRYKRCFKTATKLEKHSSFAFNGDVREFVRQSPGELWDEVWMQFPDPWPRQKKQKHRMLSASLFYGIYRMLKDGGRFCFLSDCEFYWDFLLEQNQRTKLFAVQRSQRGDLFSSEPSSRFKELFLSKNIPIFGLELRKFSSRPRQSTGLSLLPD